MPKSRFVEALKAKEARADVEIPPDVGEYSAIRKAARDRAMVDHWSPERIAARREKDKERKKIPKRPRYRPPLKVDWKKVETWYHAHPEETSREIGARFGVSHTQVQNHERAADWFGRSPARQALKEQGFYGKKAAMRRKVNMDAGDGRPVFASGRHEGRGGGRQGEPIGKPCMSVQTPGGPFPDDVSTSVPPSSPATRAGTIRASVVEADAVVPVIKRGPGRPRKVVAVPVLEVAPVSAQDARRDVLVKKPPPDQERVVEASVETSGHAAVVALVDEVEHEQEDSRLRAVAVRRPRESLRVSAAEVERADSLTEDEDQRVFGMVAENAVAVLQVAGEMIDQIKVLLERSRQDIWTEDNHGKPNETKAFLAGKGAKIAMELTVGAQEAYRVARGIAPLAPETKERGKDGKGGPLVSLNFNVAAPENPGEVQRMLDLLPVGERDVWMKALTPGKVAGMLVGETGPSLVMEAVEVESKEE